MNGVHIGLVGAQKNQELQERGVSLELPMSVEHIYLKLR
jgi:hypothetical protein